MAPTKAARLLSSALEAGAARDYDRAASLLETLIAEEDPPPEAYLYLGRSRQALGEPEKAVLAFRSFLRAGGDPGAGYFFLGRAYLSLSRLEEASACLKRSLEAAPGRAAAWAFLGAAQLRQRHSRLAVECLEKAVGLAPEDRRVYRGYLNALYARACRLVSRGEMDLARQMLDFVIANGTDGAAPRLWRARALRELGRFEEALRDCEAAVLFSPGDGDLLWLRASLLLAVGRHDEALAEFEALRRSWPDFPGLPADGRALRRLRVSAAFRDGRWKEAAFEALALIRQDPGDPALRAMAAESLRALGQYEKARDHWQRAIELDPNQGDFRLGLALALYDSGDFEGARAQAERARRMGADDGEAEYISALATARSGEKGGRVTARLQDLVRARGADPRLMFALGECLYRDGRPDLALTWFEKVLVLVPDHELSLLYRISIAESLGDAEALAPAYEAYLSAYPDNGAIRREYGDLLLKAKDWASAVPVLESGLAWGDSGETARRKLALALRNSGRYREAAIIYRDLLRASPSSAELLLALAWCLEKDGKEDFALALLEKAPEAAKATASPWIVLGLLYERRGRKEAAVDALRKATELEPGLARAWKDLGLLYRRMGLDSFASNCLERARSLGAVIEEPKADRGKPRRKATPAGDIPRPRRPPASGK